jgi:hypothetical protein
MDWVVITVIEKLLEEGKVVLRLARQGCLVHFAIQGSEPSCIRSNSRKDPHFEFASKAVSNWQDWKTAV